MSEHTFEKGTDIIRAGSHGKSAFIIQKGRVEVSIKNKYGKKQVLAVLGEKEIFGEMALVESKPRTATVTALEECVCTVLTKEVFDKLPESNPGVQAIKKIIRHRLRRK
ncbi:MAG: cyclic nucleotide-binding domain-containing protein [Nitrospinales bacterium]